MRSNIENLKLLENKKLLLCISGGIDSIFLYHKIIKSKSKYNLKIGLAHVNYNSSSKSINSMNLCRELSRSNNHPFYLKIYNKKIDSNFEHLAREFRYDFFDSVKKVENYDYILTAHNKNDLLETIYMQGDNDDFSILPYSKSNNYIIRPLIGTYRQEIEKHVKNNDYTYYDDPTNLNFKYRRNDLRINIFPKLKDRDALFQKLLNTYNLKLRKYNQTKSEFDINKKKFVRYNSSSNIIQIDMNYIKTLSVYSFKLIFQGIVKNFFNIQLNRTKKAWSEFYRQLMIPNKNILFDANSNIHIYSNTDYLYIGSIHNNFYSKKITDKIKWGNGYFSISEFYQTNFRDNENKNIFYCSKEDFNKGFFVRKWFNGDKIVISDSCSKLVSDLFNECKLIPFIRTTQPIVVQNDIITWIPGIAISNNDYLLNNNTIKIKWNESAE